jgi:LysM repeat protein
MSHHGIPIILVSLAIFAPAVKSGAEIVAGSEWLAEIRGLRAELARQSERLAALERAVADGAGPGREARGGDPPSAADEAAGEGAAGPDTAGGTTYRVKPGDRLSRIAADYGVGLGDLVAANQLSSPDRIYIGQTLTIPGPGGRYGFSGRAGEAQAVAGADVVGQHVVAPGETLYSIARQNGVSVRVLQTLNAIADPETIWAGRVLQVPVGGPAAGGGDLATDNATRPGPQDRPSAAPAATVATAGEKEGGHTVVRGESLTSIARAYGTTVSALQDANRIRDPDRLHAGQVLAIPVPGETKGGVRERGAPRPGTVDGEAAMAAAVAEPAGTGALDGSDVLSYWVVPGDSVESLASVFNTTPDRLRQINGLPAGAQFEAGTQILVPAENVFSS